MVWWRLRQYFLRLSFILANSKGEGFRIGSINITPKVALRTSQVLALYTVADEPGGDRTVGMVRVTWKKEGVVLQWAQGPPASESSLLELRSFSLIKNFLCLELNFDFFDTQNTLFHPKKTIKETIKKTI